MTHPPLEVCLTVDVEGDINGAFADPARHRPLLLESVWRTMEGRSHGLGFLLEELRRHRLRATFFLETAQFFCFGEEIMGRIAQAIRREEPGHDLQLHLHPAWRFFALADWQERLRAGEKPVDALTGLPAGQLDKLLEEARGIFQGMTGTLPTGFRSGNLETEEGLHAALARTGFRFSSCIGAGYYTPAAPALRLAQGVHTLHGVREIPVTSYRLLPLPGAPWRIITVAGTPWPELRHLLERAARAQAGPLVILTHPSEFAFRKPGDGSHYLPRPQIQARWQQLCAFLAADPSRWRVIPMAEGAAQWPESSARTAMLHGQWHGLWRRWRENR